MTRKTVTSLAFAALCMAGFAAAPSAAQAEEMILKDQMITNGPQADRGDFRGNWSATRNNIESQRYDQLVQTSPGFRSARMRRECGPITDPQLRSDCLASFQQYEPSGIGYGSSMPPHRLRHHRHFESLGQ